jgi:hypothetical protein
MYINKESSQNSKNKVICHKCGNDSFHVYITLFIDDARLYCSKCGEFNP